MLYRLRKMEWDNGESVCAVIDCKLELIPVTLLIDTGATISLLDYDFVNRHPAMELIVEPSDTLVVLTDLYQNPKNCEEIVKSTKLKIGKTNFSQRFFLTELWKQKRPKDLHYHGILGLDFMLKHEARLNFSNFSIEISE